MSETQTTARREALTAGPGGDPLDIAPGVVFRPLASGANGARGLCTGTATIEPGAHIPAHTHPISEVIIPLTGFVYITVQGRRYRVGPYDAMHVPAGVVHAIANASRDQSVRCFVTFASAAPTREWVSDESTIVNRDKTTDEHPEHLTRFADAPIYELSNEAQFRDLFAGRFGAKGICGGYGIFQPGASLPCHIHGYDESITIVEGTAICQVAGNEYTVSDLGTACVPEGRPHRFINRSDQPMAMLWVYAGDEPDRTILDQAYCDGTRCLAAD